jgi:hypothetical protein
MPTILLYNQYNIRTAARRIVPNAAAKLQFSEDFM